MNGPLPSRRRTDLLRSPDMARRSAVGALTATLFLLSGCCSETDYDVAIERAETSERTCTAICDDYLDDFVGDLTYELRSCGDDESEDGRELVVCHVTEVDCRSSNHF